MKHTKLVAIVLFSLLMTGCSVPQKEGQINIETENYHEFVTNITDKQVEDNLDEVYESEIGKIETWFDESADIQLSKPMIEIELGDTCIDQQECNLSEILVEKLSELGDLYVNNCTSDVNCEKSNLKVSSEFLENASLVSVYTDGENIYTAGYSDIDNRIYQVWENETKLFTDDMEYGADGPIFQAASIMDFPVFVYRQLVENTEEEEPAIRIITWYKGETLNEKYDLDDTSLPFEFEGKLGFVGTKEGQSAIYFDGQKVSGDFDEVRTISCCAIFAYPVKLDSNGVLQFLGRRGEEYYISEIKLVK